ncbi:hypothetical protein FKO01_05015 [Mesorhizobium sp. B2-3-3]|nr:hypothetical protein FKO01_05015 [Mesorhizobium sp. B2-3-3]
MSACHHCGGSLAGKRADARFCSARCRLTSHRHEAGRIDDVPSGYIIDKPTRDMLIEANSLNPQDEGNAQKVREAFSLFVREHSKKYA